MARSTLVPPITSHQPAADLDEQGRGLAEARGEIGGRALEGSEVWGLVIVG